MAENIIKPSYKDVQAILSLFDEFDESELTSDELHARDTMRLIRQLQEQKHSDNLRLYSRIQHRRSSEPKEGEK